MHATIRAAPPAGQALWKKAVILSIIALVLAAFFYFDLTRWLSFEALKANRDALLSFTESNYPAAVPLFIAVYVLVTALSIPGAVVLTLAAGFLFGTVLGTLYVNVGATTGATLAFLAARYVLRDWVEQRFGDRLGPLQAGFAREAFSYLLTLRLLPIFRLCLCRATAGDAEFDLGDRLSARPAGVHAARSTGHAAGPLSKGEGAAPRP
jgi:uncharacterized membrane protein YdjX (TVP38/TMEM64 family)